MTRQAPGPCPECGAACKEWYMHKESYLCGTVLHKNEDDGDELERSQVCCNNVNTRTIQRYRQMEVAIAVVAAQKADDHCWMDFVKLFDTLCGIIGLPVPPRTVGSKNAMMKNCERFINEVCIEGGGWRSYAELEAENKRLTEEASKGHSADLAAMRKVVEDAERMLRFTPPPEHLAKDNQWHRTIEAAQAALRGETGKEFLQALRDAEHVISKGIEVRIGDTWPALAEVLPSTLAQLRKALGKETIT